MDELKALGLFMNHCNQHAGDPGMTQKVFSDGIFEILNSSEERFRQCNNVSDVLDELRRGKFKEE